MEEVLPLRIYLFPESVTKLEKKVLQNKRGIPVDLSMFFIISLCPIGCAELFTFSSRIQVFFSYVFNIPESVHSSIRVTGSDQSLIKRP